MKEIVHRLKQMLWGGRGVGGLCRLAEIKFNFPETGSCNHHLKKLSTEPSELKKFKSNSFEDKTSFIIKMTKSEIMESVLEVEHNERDMKIVKPQMMSSCLS